jgi:hypothetical protein
MTTTTPTTADVDRLYALWRLAVEKSLATGDRAACREALRRFEAYTIARERAAEVGA